MSNRERMIMIASMVVAGLWLFDQIMLGPWLERWAPRLIDIHISDTVPHVWVDPHHYLNVFINEVHLPIGSGNNDFAAIIDTLNRIGYDDCLTIEIFPQNCRSVEDIMTSRARLETLTRGGG